MQASPFARVLFALYVVLVSYASLYPMTGWRVPGAPLFAFLSTPWPPYNTRFDIAVNVLGYLPYGLLCVLAFHPKLRGLAALALAVTSALVLSLGLETTQNFIALRHASTLDMAANTAGAMAGAAAGLAFAPWLLHAGPLRRLRGRLFQQGLAADLGLAVLGLWLFVQLNPAMLLFGSGDLRDLFATPEGPAHAPSVFVGIEALTVACNVVAVALLVSLLASEPRFVRIEVASLVLAALGLRTAAYAIVMRAEDVFAWLTRGAVQGLIAGVVAAWLIAGIPRTLRIVLAALLVMSAAILVNLAPANPYLAATLAVWRQGHFLNFNGLTRLVAAAWPFAALAYLIYFAALRGER